MLVRAAQVMGIRWVVVLVLLVQAGCGSPGGASAGRTGLDWGRTPPAQPGSSITHTRLCECRACEDAACCGGADEEQAACDAQEVNESIEGDNAVVDFSSSEGCGIELRSCSVSCARRVWRVDQQASCAADRPAECCS